MRMNSHLFFFSKKISLTFPLILYKKRTRIVFSLMSIINRIEDELDF